MKKALFSMLSLMMFLAGCALNNNENLSQEGDGGMGVQQVRYNNTNEGGNNIYGEANPADPAYGMADQMANKVMKLYEVERAYVYIKGVHAYVAVILENRLEHQLDAELQSEVEETVKSVNGEIEHVYVSNDRNVVSNLKTYRGQIHSGRPVEDLGERIEEQFSSRFNIQ
ncbi:MAG: YhcN/YlaJ family sporulation lipoprotein [Bacillota bacterium]